MSISVSVSGNTISINEEVFDFSPLHDGDTLPRAAIDSPWFAGDVTRVDGVLHVSLVFPHGAYAGEAACFPVPITVIQDGPVQLPDSGHDAPLPEFSGPVVEPDPVQEESPAPVKEESHEQD
ncbi:hypothetical protein [Comamonas testosteroni]|uniref:hypothetical protein n=1 Tax=Comamonas testosteroni TaxID=285 RepID=UPI00187CADD1|nr:hypothetical protein [Comamonas testosteroni]